jgi:hypothetical protein
MAVKAAKAVVDTLTEADFATVIGFSSRANKMDSRLKQATMANKKSMRDWIDRNIDASGTTNFRAAF